MIDFTGIFFYQNEIRECIQSYRHKEIIQTPFIVLTKRPEYYNAKLIGLRVYATPAGYGNNSFAEALLVSLETANTSLQRELKNTGKEHFSIQISREPTPKPVFNYMQYGPVPNPDIRYLHGTYGIMENGVIRF